MENNWISVKDRLPDHMTKVIVNCEHGVTLAEFMLFANGNTLWWVIIHIGAYEDSSSADNVTHWMPLPEPPNQ